MADLSDVENALAGQVVTALYPNGVESESVSGKLCRIYRGWPTAASLNADLAAGVVNVTVFPALAAAADDAPPAYFPVPHVTATQAGFEAAVNGERIIITGAPSANEAIGVLIDGVPYSYRVLAGDSTESIAANLGAAVRLNRFVTIEHSTIIVPGARSLRAQVAGVNAVSWGARRQRRNIQIICWCPDPLTRDLIARAIDAKLATQVFIDLADLTTAHIRYVSTQIFDQSQTSLLYRRDLLYGFDYTLIVESTVPTMLFGELVANQSVVYS